MNAKTDYFLKALNVLSWIIFIGLCVQAGGIIVNTFITLWLNPAGAGKFWMEINLIELHQYNQSFFITLASQIIIVAVLKAIMFYLIVKTFHDKKLTLSEPFNETVRQFIALIAWLALGIGLFSHWGTKFTENLIAQGVNLPNIQQMGLAGADVWFFMGVALLVIARIFKRGIELQNENDLTI